MTDHQHVFRVVQLTEQEAESLCHPYYRAGASVFVCVIPECGMISTGNPALDAKKPRRVG